MKIVAIGSVKFSKIVFSYLLKKKIKIHTIFGKKKSNFNTDFFDLVKFFSKKKINSYYSNDINSKKTISILKKIQPDLILCVGWSRLLKNEILKIPKIGTIGYHPADLPSNRGRHPIIWALALGLNRIGSTLFFMNKTADSGPIISKRFIKITSNDNSTKLYYKLSKMACNQLLESIKKIKEGKIKKINQTNKTSNFWRRRTDKDGIIDWRMSAETIINLVRALNEPYPGAHFFYKNKKIKVWKVCKSVANKNHEPGKIFNLKGSNPIIKCGDAAVIIKKMSPKVNFKLNTYL